MSLFSRWIDHIRERRDARELTPTGILHKAEANLEPGILTADGFLGRDNRRLLRILGDDAREFADQGLDWAAVANRLEEFLDLGAAGLGEPITVEGRYLVHVAETRGLFPCPWEDGLWRKRSVSVKRLGDTASGAEILFSDLSLHLLKEHHFLQGKGSPFRLEPAVLKAVLA